MPRVVKFPCIPAQQGAHKMFVFCADAKTLWGILKINRRKEDKDEGYQRALSPARVKQIARYYDSGKAIPGALIVAFDKAKIEDGGKTIAITNDDDAGWVIDGQHRLAGAHESTSGSIGLPVVAFVDLNLEDQISFFVTINREQKGVSSSLYYDLLQKLPTNRSAVEVIQERAAELAGILRKDSSSPFFGRIKVTTSPKKGELSMTNFIRKVTPHLRDDGRLQIYNDLERAAFLNNLYRALEAAFPKEWKRSDCVFFRTIGFGAIIDTLPVIMDAAFAVAKRNRFRVENVVEALQLIRDFDFDAWRQMGTGNAGEKSAASDLKARLQDEMKEVKGGVVEL